MRYETIRPTDVANGPGVRVSIFVTGCTLHCKGCFNKELQDFNHGTIFTNTEINKIIDLLSKDYIKGLSILGGEPFEYVNQKGLLPLLRKVREVYPSKTIWCYSGNTLETIKNMPYNETKEMLSLIDVLVDGKFEEDKKDLKLKFKGSSNQRIIELKTGNLLY